MLGCLQKSWVLEVRTEAGWFPSSSSTYFVGGHSIRCSDAALEAMLGPHTRGLDRVCSSASANSRDGVTLHRSWLRAAGSSWSEVFLSHRCPLKKPLEESEDAFTSYFLLTSSLPNQAVLARAAPVLRTCRLPLPAACGLPFLLGEERMLSRFLTEREITHFEVFKMLPKHFCE